jgi:hypothetical protein
MSETCTSCAKEQKKAGKEPRVLLEIRREALTNGFDKNAPAWLCYYCDGDAYQSADATHRVYPSSEDEDVG